MISAIKRREYIDFIDYRCDDNGGSGYDRQCIYQSIKDIFTVNYDSLTSTINVDGEKENISLVWEYVNKIHGVIQNYDAVQKNVIEIEGMELTVSQAYYQVLPWHLNISTIMIFHNFTMQKIDLLMDVYLYRHVTLIVWYINHMGITAVIDDTMFQHLNKSVEWYGTITDVFYYYLCLSGAYIRSQDPIGVINLFTQKSNNRQISEIQNLIPDHQTKYLTDWINKVFKGSPPDNSIKPLTESYLQQLTGRLQSNCKHALSYVDMFLSVLEDSIIFTGNKKIEKFDSKIDKLCSTFDTFYSTLHDILDKSVTPISVPTGVNSPVLH